MNIPSDDQIKADAAFLGFTPKETDKILEHARRTRTGSTELDGFKKNHGATGGRPSGVSDPVGDMVIADDRPTPQVEKQQALLFDMFTQAAASKRAVRNTLDALDGEQEWRRPQGHVSTPCKVDGCDTEASKRGFCDTDNRADLRYQEKHGEPMPMGLMEANARERQTKKRRRVA